PRVEQKVVHVFHLNADGKVTDWWNFWEDQEASTIYWRKRPSSSRLSRRLSAACPRGSDRPGRASPYGRPKMSVMARAKLGKAAKATRDRITRPAVTRRRSRQTPATAGTWLADTPATPVLAAPRATEPRASSSSGTWAMMARGVRASSGTARLSRPARAASNMP